MLYIFAAFLALTIADAWLTYRVIINGGRELNPLLSNLMARIGLIPALAVSKSIGIIAALYMVFSGIPAAVYVLGVLTAILAGIVAWNAAHYLKRN